MPDAGALCAAGLRIDKFLWFVRLAPSRSAAASLAQAGHVRLDGRRVDRAHACVRVGSVLSLPHGAGARVVRVEALPARRGPFGEASACYTALEPMTVGARAVDERRGDGLAAFPNKEASP